MTDKIYTPRSFTLIQYREYQIIYSMGHAYEYISDHMDIIYASNFDDLLEQLRVFAHLELDRCSSNYNCEYTLLIDGVSEDEIHIISDKDNVQNQELYNYLSTLFSNYKHDIDLKIRKYIRIINSEKEEKERLERLERLKVQKEEREKNKNKIHKTKIEKDKEKFNELKNKYGW